jgi:hypothetical protein
VSPHKITVWGVTSWKGTDSLHAVNETTPKEEYIQILDNYLFSERKECFTDDGIFTQDGGSCHTATAVMNYLQSQRRSAEMAGKQRRHDSN